MSKRTFTPARIVSTTTGKNGTGYIDNATGLTYKDAEGKERIDVGTTVFTNGGTYTLTGAGSVKTPESIYSDLQKASAAARGQLDAMNQANQRSIKKRTQQQVARIDGQRRNIDQNYRDSNRAAYRAYVQAINPYGAAAEQQAQLGLDNSGYSESSKLRLGNAYQSAMNDNAIARSEYLNELEAARRDALYNGDAETADALSEYAQLVYSHGIDTAERLAEQGERAYSDAMDLNDRIWDKNMYIDDRDYQRARDAAQDRLLEEQERWQQAMQLAKAGFSNAEIAKRLGVTLAELDRIASRYR